MSRSRPLDPDVRRAQLLAAAQKVFSERGYHATGVADIIEAAGVARGTFYNYFESKRTVFQAVLEALLSDITAAIAPIDVTRPIAPQVRDDIEQVVVVLLEMGRGVRILFTDADGIDVESTETLADFYETALNRLAKALATGQRLGIVRPGDVSLMALLLIGMLREPVYQAALRGRTLEPAALADEVFATVIGGVVAIRLPETALQTPH